MLHATSSLSDFEHERLSEQYDVLGKRLNRFLQGIISHHNEPYR